MKEYQHVQMEFAPIYNENSRILILGSFPSVKSRETSFYYGHPQNRFWRVIAALTECPVPQTIEEKKQLLITHGIALWDVIESCDIIGSSDSSIRNVIPAKIPELLQETGICRVYANGGTASRLYDRYILHQSQIPAVKLPSTSPANARADLDTLIREWSRIIQL